MMKYQCINKFKTENFKWALGWKNIKDSTSYDVFYELPVNKIFQKGVFYNFND